MRNSLKIFTLAIFSTLAFLGCASQQTASWQSASLEGPSHDLSHFAREQAKNPELQGTFVVSQKSLRERGISLDEAMQELASGKSESVKRIYVAGGSDDVSNTLTAVTNRSGDKYRQDVDGITFIVSKSCLEKHGVTAEEAIARMAGGKCDCAKVVVLKGEGTDDFEIFNLLNDGSVLIQK